MGPWRELRPFVLRGKQHGIQWRVKATEKRETNMDLEDDDEKGTTKETGEAGETEKDEGGKKPKAKTEEAAETETEDEGDEDEKDRKADDDDPPLEGLTEKQLAKVDKRIGKVVAREKSKTEAAEARANEAEEKLKHATFTDPETQLPFPSDYVSAAEVQTLKKLDELKAARKMLRPLRREGYEGENGAKFTPAQVEARLDEIEEQLESLLPKATTIRARAEQQFAADMKELRELRKQKAAGTLRTTPAPKKDVKTPPQAPGSSRGAAGGAGPAGGAKKTVSAIAEGEVHDKDSFRAQLAKAMGVR